MDYTELQDVIQEVLMKGRRYAYQKFRDCREYDEKEFSYEFY